MTLRGGILHEYGVGVPCVCVFAFAWMCLRLRGLPDACRTLALCLLKLPEGTAIAPQMRVVLLRVLFYMSMA